MRWIILGLWTWTGCGPEAQDASTAWRPTEETELLRTDAQVAPYGYSAAGMLVVFFGGLDNRLWALDLRDGTVWDIDDDVDRNTIRLAPDGSRLAYHTMTPPSTRGWLRGAGAPVQLLDDADRLAVTSERIGASSRTLGEAVLWDGESLQTLPGATIMEQPFSPDNLVVAGPEGALDALGPDAARAEGTPHGVHEAHRVAGQWLIIDPFGSAWAGPTGTEQELPLTVRDVIHIDENYALLRDENREAWALGRSGELHHCAGPTVFRDEVAPAHGGYYLNDDRTVIWWQPGEECQLQYSGVSISRVVPDAEGAMVVDQVQGHAYAPLGGSPPTTFEDTARAFLAPDGDWVLRRGASAWPGEVFRWNPVEGARTIIASGELHGQAIASQSLDGTTVVSDLDATPQLLVDGEVSFAVVIDELLLTSVNDEDGTYRVLGSPWHRDSRVTD